MNKITKSFGLSLLLLLGIQQVRAVPVAETAHYVADKVFQTNVVQEMVKQFPNGSFWMFSGATVMASLALGLAAVYYCCDGCECGEDLQWDPQRDKRH